MTFLWKFLGSCIAGKEAEMEKRKEMIVKRKKSLDGRRGLLERKIREIDTERSQYKADAEGFLLNKERGRAALELNKYDNAALNVARFSKFHASVVRLSGMLDRFLVSEDLMNEFGDMRAEVKMLKDSVSEKEGATEGANTDALQDEIFDVEGLFDHLDKQVAEISNSPLGLEDYDDLTEDQGERLKKFERELRGEEGEDEEKARVVPAAVASTPSPSRVGIGIGIGARAKPLSSVEDVGSRKKPRPSAKSAILVDERKEEKRAEERREAATLCD